ncbi:MAG: DUF1987 domain-containing protein [Bacteroidota bacterium]
MLIQIEAKDNLPKVIFNEAEGTLLISGKSYPQNADQFYLPIISKLSNYLNQPKNKTTINLEIEYFQTTSQRFLLQILSMFLKAIPKENLEINWFYSSEDEDEEDYVFAGHEIEKILHTEFNFIKK